MNEIKKGNNMFYIGEGEETAKAKITFMENDGFLTVDHTFVSDELRGGGIAGKLVDQVVQYAREEGKKIHPVCDYAKKKIDRTPEYQDVLA